MAPQRSVSMNRMWFDFKDTFPESNTAQDGWIGDLAHASGTSGHNPDDTPGVSAERQDADSKQEVRAIDKDNRLNNPRGVTLEHVVQRMLTTADDLKRLIYIIYKRRVWKKSNGWKQETYTGSDPHDLHAHFSGDPASDENGAEWKSITSFKQGVAMASVLTTDEQRRLKNVDEYEYGKIKELDPLPKIVGGNGVETPLDNLPLRRQIKLQDSIDTLIQRPVAPPTDAQWTAFTAAVVAKLEELFASKVGEAAEIAVTEVLNRTRLAVQPAPEPQ